MLEQIVLAVVFAFGLIYTAVWVWVGLKIERDLDDLRKELDAKENEQ